jgi:very-short-patch-repair endonuclease
MTRAEKAMWDMLRDLRPLGARFRRETPIGPYIADFAWLSARLVIEVDGDIHETLAGRAHDIRRDAYMQGQGFHVMRFDNDDVLEAPNHTFLTIQAAVSEHLKERQS